MFSLSTSWNSDRHDDGFGLIEEIRLAGFDTVELGFGVVGVEAAVAVRDGQILLEGLADEAEAGKEVLVGEVFRESLGLVDWRAEEGKERAEGGAAGER